MLRYCFKRDYLDFKKVETGSMLQMLQTNMIELSLMRQVNNLLFMECYFGDTRLDLCSNSLTCRVTRTNKNFLSLAFA